MFSHLYEEKKKKRRKKDVHKIIIFIIIVIIIIINNNKGNLTHNFEVGIDMFFLLKYQSSLLLLLQPFFYRKEAQPPLSPLSSFNYSSITFPQATRFWHYFPMYCHLDHRSHFSNGLRPCFLIVQYCHLPCKCLDNTKWKVPTQLTRLVTTGTNRACSAPDPNIIRHIKKN